MKREPWHQHNEGLIDGIYRRCQTVFELVSACPVRGSKKARACDKCAAIGIPARCVDSPEAIAFYVAMDAISRGVICPKWAAQSVAKTWHQFEDLQHRTLGRAFGIKDNKDIAKKYRQRTLGLANLAYNARMRLQSDGSSRRDKLSPSSAAWEDVSAAMPQRPATRRKRSAKTVEAQRTEWRKLCKEMELDPDSAHAVDAYSQSFTGIYRTLATAALIEGSKDRRQK